MPTLDLGKVVGQGVPAGGTAGQVLVKNSDSNFDAKWSYCGHTLLFDKTSTAACSSLSAELSGIDFSVWHKLEGRFSLPQHPKTIQIRLNGITTQTYYPSILGTYSTSTASRRAYIIDTYKSGQDRMDIEFFVPLYMREWQEAVVYVHTLALPNDSHCNMVYACRVEGVTWANLTTVDLTCTTEDIPSGTHIQIWGVS